MSDNNNPIICRMEVSKKRRKKKVTDQKSIKAKISFRIKLYKYVLASRINHFYSFCQFTPLDEVRAGKSRHSPWFFPPAGLFLPTLFWCHRDFLFYPGTFFLRRDAFLNLARGPLLHVHLFLPSSFSPPPFSLSPSVCARSAKFGPSRLNVKNQQPRIARIAQRQLSPPPSPLLVSLSLSSFPFLSSSPGGDSLIAGWFSNS